MSHFTVQFVRSEYAVATYRAAGRGLGLTWGQRGHRLPAARGGGTAAPQAGYRPAARRRLPLRDRTQAALRGARQRVECCRAAGAASSAASVQSPRRLGAI